MTESQSIEQTILSLTDEERDTLHLLEARRQKQTTKAAHKATRIAIRSARISFGFILFCFAIYIFNQWSDIFSIKFPALTLADVVKALLVPFVWGYLFYWSWVSAFGPPPKLETEEEAAYRLIQEAVKQVQERKQNHL